MNTLGATGAVRFFLVLTVIFFPACGGDEEPDGDPPEPKPLTITVDPAALKQEMIGFGGALTWYSNLMTASSKKQEIADLIFNDSGIDIIRFKTWYYPDGYPAVTSTAVMTDDNAKLLWDTTNELYGLAIDRNPDIKTLLASWGPPRELKSNNNTREGTLKKDGANFMYDAYADYWVAVLDHVPFNPDYLSIQNEPTFITPGWTTCQWSASESFSLPGYNVAFDKVYDKIKNRVHVPIMIGPESQDVPTFASFANILKDKPHCGALAWHPYNVNSGTSAAQVITSTQTIGSFNTKPNIMTEFSDNLDWYNTALFIQRSLLYANTSGYIYWKLVWSKPQSGTDAAMVSITSTGQYTVTPYYHLIKHFAKNINAGYHRVGVSTTNTTLLSSAFLNPDNSKITLVIINDGPVSLEVAFVATGKTIAGITADQSKQGEYYKPVDIASPEAPVTLPAKSITTVVLDI